MLTTLVLAACGGSAPGAVPEAPGRAARELTTRNGTNLNGTNLNGTNLNGTNLNGSDLGSTLVSVAFDGAFRAEGTYEGVELHGSAFWGSLNGTLQHGAAFAGAHFIGQRGDGQSVELRIDEVTASGDLWAYRVSAWNADAQAWRPLCTDGDGQPMTALALNGRWDYRQGVEGGGAQIDDPGAFTFACDGYAIAKCVRMDYRPWATTAEGVSLKAHHQACVRSLRADYCGDGASHTVNGQWVNLYDAVGVQSDTEEWTLEAEWGTGGALCLSAHNRAQGTITCASGTLPPACGDTGSFAGGALLITETP